MLLGGESRKRLMLMHFLRGDIFSTAIYVKYPGSGPLEDVATRVCTSMFATCYFKVNH